MCKHICEVERLPKSGELGVLTIFANNEKNL